MRRRFGWGAAALALFCLFGPLRPEPVLAHVLRPAVAAVTLEGETALVELYINVESYLAGLPPDHDTTEPAPEYDRLSGVAPEALADAFAPRAAVFLDQVALAFDGAQVPLAYERVDVPTAGGPEAVPRVSRVVARAQVPDGAGALTLTLAPALGDAIVRVTRAGEETPIHTDGLAAGDMTAPIDLAGSASAGTGVLGYVKIGFEHILPKGLDHIVFVVGLFLLSARWRPLLAQVTSFTIAHSITLALGIYGIIAIPASIVEPLIAASIVFIAVENIYTSRLSRWRPFVVFGFGLLHGLGFAGVLREIGLPSDQFVQALVGFNVGVELGQLTVLAICFAAVGFWFRDKGWYRSAITTPASCAIALIGAFWFVERVI